MRVIHFAAACHLLVLSAGAANAEPQIATPGDAERGRAVVVDRELGHCLLCHAIRQVDEPFQGNIGPDLSNIGARLSTAELRDRIVDPTRSNPESVMPAYHRTANLNNVGVAYEGEPILNKQQVEDVVAFLATLTQ